MKVFFQLVLCIVVGTFTLNAQINLADLPYDSISIKRNENGKIFQGDYYFKHQLVMQKFYPNGSSIGGFCNGSNLVYDSVIVHLGTANYVANFELGGGAINVYSWQTNSNLLKTSSYTNKGILIGFIEEEKVPDASSLYPPCWFQGYRTGREKRPADKKAVTEKSTKPTSQGMPDTLLNRLKSNALAVLREYYSKDFIAKHLVFSQQRSCFYKAVNKSYYKREEPSPNSGFPLGSFTLADSLFSLVDIAFDIQLEAYQFPIISLRFDRQGKLVTRPIKTWSSQQSACTGLLLEKAKSVINPSAAKKIATKHSKWPITGNVVVNLKWEERSPGDSLGKLVYEIGYDLFRHSFDASYVRQVVIDAASGAFVTERELASEIASVQSSGKFTENGKTGFKDFGQVVIPAEYDELPPYYAFIMIARKGNKYGLINGKNELLLPFEFDKIEYWRSPLSRYNNWLLNVKKDGKQGLYQVNKGMVFEANYTTLTENIQEQIVAKTADGKEQVYNMRTGNLLK